MAGLAKNLEYDMAFASNYVVVRRDKVDLKGLYRLFVSGDLQQKFTILASPKPGVIALVDTFTVFVCAALLWVLSWLRLPFKLLGDALETSLNLLSNNGGFFRLILNSLRGKLHKPKKSSKEYRSVAAHLDGRVDIDSSLKHGDDRYYEALSLLASKIAYENADYIRDVVQNQWKMELLGTYDFWNEFLYESTTQAFMMREKNGDSETILVAFRGTEPFNTGDWSCDVDLSWFKIRGWGKMHAGFMAALGLQKHTGWPKEIEQDPTHPTAYYYIRGELRKLFEANPSAKFIVTGHSLGGALAIVFPSVLAHHEETALLKRLHAVYTFGQPRVGDSKFGETVHKSFKRNGVKYIRFVYSNDMVPRVPYDDSGFMYRHFGTCLYYNSRYVGRIVRSEPFKNYFSIFGIIPMSVVAAWEIIRGFVYPYMKGPACREGWLMFSMRLFGLIVPGMPPHIPQDYNNSFRIGYLVGRLKDEIEEKIDDALHRNENSKA